MRIDDVAINDSIVDIGQIQTLARCGHMDFTIVERVESRNRSTSSATQQQLGWRSVGASADVQ